MKLFEYTRKVKKYELSIEELNAYGKQGWDLVEVIFYNEGASYNPFFSYYFKRERRNEDQKERKVEVGS